MNVFAFMLLFCVGDLPETLAPLLTTGDEAFFRIDYPAAVESYRQALDGDSSNAGVLWRLARAFVCMGEVATGDEARDLFLKAEWAARRCVMLDPASPGGHVWLAASLGYLSLEADAGEQITLAHELLDHAEKALTIDSANDAAYSIKGSFYRALGNIGWVKRSLAKLFVGDIPSGGYEEAETALLRAIILAPDIMRHHYELGVLYLDWGREGDAVQALRKATTLPVRVAIDRPRLEKIRALLRKLERAP